MDAQDFLHEGLLVPTRPCASRSSSARMTTADGVVEGTVQCSFCKESVTASQAMNKAGRDARNDRWRCVECHAAEARMIAAATTAPEKRALKQLRQTPDLYSLKVTQLRRSHVRNQSQKHAIKRYYQELEAESRAYKKESFRLMAWPAFKYHCKTQRGADSPTAEREWRAERDNPEARWSTDRTPTA